MNRWCLFVALLLLSGCALRAGVSTDVTLSHITRQEDRVSYVVHHEQACWQHFVTSTGLFVTAYPRCPEALKEKR